ncbi:MAG: rhodanese-like domain-containing protein [Saprospiraceae bacterium]|nr:rhodanese-like domain-containing protein [Saprospiraceae bacterium]
MTFTTTRLALQSRMILVTCTGNSRHHIVLGKKRYTTDIMKKSLFWSVSFLLFACTGSNKVTPVTADQLVDMMQKDKTVQLIDLRTPEEQAATGMIPGAKPVDFNSTDFDARIAQINHDNPVIVYCATGGRSGRASAQMAKMGFKKVYNYEGGMRDWGRRK